MPLHSRPLNGNAVGRAITADLRDCFIGGTFGRFCKRCRHGECNLQLLKESFIVAENSLLIIIIIVIIVITFIVIPISIL